MGRSITSPVSHNIPAGTRRHNNVFTTSTRRRRRRVDVVKTLSLRYYCVMCPLGCDGKLWQVYRMLFICRVVLVVIREPMGTFVAQEISDNYLCFIIITYRNHFVSRWRSLPSPILILALRRHSSTVLKYCLMIFIRLSVISSWTGLWSNDCQFGTMHKNANVHVRDVTRFASRHLTMASHDRYVSQFIGNWIVLSTTCSGW